MVGHGSLKITKQGSEFLSQKQQIELRKYKKKSTNPKKELKIKSTLTKNQLNDDDLILFDQLKAKRLELAKRQNLPPYIIFHDKTLIQMTQIKPQTLEQMSKISGVGQNKISKYGQIFLEIINE
jgi:ATP-dependent DNA helicase RecQ